MYAEPLEDFYILICPFVPFGTCALRADPHGNPMRNQDVAGASKGDANVP